MKIFPLLVEESSSALTMALVFLFHWLWQFAGMQNWTRHLREIAIIVFSVLLATWLENYRQYLQDQDQVKEFLLGLRQDLKRDIQEMEVDMSTYKRNRNGFQYFSSIQKKEDLKPDSISKYAWLFYSNTQLVPNDGGFQGFKSSGKLYSIEDRELRTEILDLYQEIIPMVLGSTQSFQEKKTRLALFFEDNLKYDAEGNSNNLELILSPKFRNIGNSLAFIDEILDRYEKAIHTSSSIVKRIEAQYPEVKEN